MTKPAAAPHVYLDHNATSPLRPEAAAAMAEAGSVGANSSSIHGPGRAANQIMTRAREALAKLIGAAPDQVVFMSGGTEANNLALRGLGNIDCLMISAIEHPSIWQTAPQTGLPVIKLPVDSDGVIKLDVLAAELEKASLAGKRALVSVMLANNETGVLQPVAQVVELAKKYDAYVHTDAVQSLGKIPVGFETLGVDLMSLSAHKIGGPQGVGALIVASGIALQTQITGGGQELGRRGGTENLPGIAGFGAAARVVLADHGFSEAGKVAALRENMETRLTDQIPELVILSQNVPRLPNTSALALPGRQAETLVIQCDLEGLAISAGAACSSGKVSRSHVVEAMGVGNDIANATVRVSLGWNSNQNDIDRFVETYTHIASRTDRRVSVA